MTITRNLLRPLLVLLFAATATTLVVAQVPGGPGGPRSPGPGGAPLAMLLLNTQVSSALALTADQQVLWTALQAADQNARAQHDAARAAMQTLITGQFASGTPDLVAIEQAMLAEHQGMEPVAAALSARAIALYSTLNTGQRAIVVTAAQARYEQTRRQ